MPSRPAEPRPVGGADAIDEAPRVNSIAFDERLSAVGSKFGKDLNSLINEGILDNDQAARIVQEIEMDFAVRTVRLDLLRAAHKLQRIGDGVPGSPRSQEIDRLRTQLRSMLDQPTPAVLGLPGKPPFPNRAPE